MGTLQTSPVPTGAEFHHVAGLTPEVPYLKQPLTRPISEQQLINEVKGIYAGLVLVEKKCVEIVHQQSQNSKRLENQQWKALVALHRTLLQEHHDFFSASQHPTSSDALNRLAIKYAMPARMWRHGIHAFLELLRRRMPDSMEHMPARMWRHGIHAFLELLRHRMPDSMEHMLSFIYLSYSMIALLKASVSSFVETWIECLGDLARYRMAIEDSDPRDRETWSNVARMWYNEAADQSPNVGRIQHHLAILARPNIVEQFFYHSKLITSVVPFTNARESIFLSFDMFFKNNKQIQTRCLMSEAHLTRVVALMSTRSSVHSLRTQSTPFSTRFAEHYSECSFQMKVPGFQIATALVTGYIDFGTQHSICSNTPLQTLDISTISLQNMAVAISNFGCPNSDNGVLSSEPTQSSRCWFTNINLLFGHGQQLKTNLGVGLRIILSIVMSSIMLIGIIQGQILSCTIGARPSKLRHVKLSSVMFCFICFNCRLAKAYPTGNPPTKHTHGLADAESPDIMTSLLSLILLFAFAILVLFVVEKVAFRDRVSTSGILAFSFALSTGFANRSNFPFYVTSISAGISLGSSCRLGLSTATRSNSPIKHFIRYGAGGTLLYIGLQGFVQWEADPSSQRFWTVAAPLLAVVGVVTINALLNELCTDLTSFISRIFTRPQAEREYAP